MVCIIILCFAFLKFWHKYIGDKWDCIDLHHCCYAVEEPYVPLKQEQPCFFRDWKNKISGMAACLLLLEFVCWWNLLDIWVLLWLCPSCSIWPLTSAPELVYIILIMLSVDLESICMADFLHQVVFYCSRNLRCSPYCRWLSWEATRSLKWGV